MTRPRRSHRRSIGTRLGTLACLLLAGLAGSSACGSDGGSSHSPPTIGGQPDRPSNGVISVDEAGITATVVDGKLELDVPVTALGSGTSGALFVSTTAVDGASSIEKASVAYDLGAGATAVLHATLAVPAGVVEQSDWVSFNLRVDDGASDGLLTTTSLLRVVKPYELRLEGPGSVSRDKTVSYRVHAEEPKTRKPIANLKVEVELAEEARDPRTLEGTTDASGEAVFTVSAGTTGAMSVKAKTAMSGTTTTLEHSVNVTAPGRKVLVTTDKPIYQPGQTIHLRAVTLLPPKNTPLANASALFEIEDGKGNKILKKDVTSDDYGIAHTAFRIGSIVNEGTFKVRVTVDGQATEKTVSVSRYALPKFGVEVTVGKTWYGPGESVSGTLDARYFFGKAAAGADVVVEGFTLDVGETVFARVVGKTDAEGKMPFDLLLPQTLVGLPLEQGNALASLRFTVVDTAGQKVTKELPLTVTDTPVRVSAIPESTTLVPGVENRLEIFVSDPLGEPAALAAVHATVGAAVLDGTTDAFGHVELRFTPEAGTAFTADVSATPDGGQTVSKTFSFGGQEGAEHVLVRTDKSVYDVGDTVTVEVVASDSAAHAYVDWLNEGQAVDMRTLDLTDGVARFTMPLDTTLLGNNRVEAYVVDPDGNFVRAGRTLFARSDASLSVSMTTDKAAYAPGEPATLTFSVKDAAGAPQVAALGVQIVDEAVFSLVDARPGLLETYFQLEDDFARPTYELDAPPVSFQELLFDKTRSADAEEANAAQTKTEAALAALGARSVTGFQGSSFTDMLPEIQGLLAPRYDTLRASLAKSLEPIVGEALARLALEGCTARVYYCEKRQTDFATALGSEVNSAFTAVDFWGNAFTGAAGGYGSLLVLTTRGPDEEAGTKDDATLSIAYSDLDLDEVLRQGGKEAADGDNAGPGGPFPLPPPQAGGGPVFGVGGAAGFPTEGPPTTPGGPDTAAGPRVRRDFPETLYVNPAVITGPDGTASVSLDLADSITKWRVSSLAHSKGGALGGGTSGVTVFQDFFVDIDFPATLTRGDRIEFPIAVYNYLGVAQTVHLTLDAAPWYTALGETALDVALAPGEVKGVRFPVQVDRVGTNTLTVRGAGTSLSDAVARTVTVVPDGKAYPATASGSLAPGSVTESVTFPADAVVGSNKLYVNVYPAFLAQAVSGMDSMLQVPSGCFEQTTSNAWPNVLVTEYMTETGQITPDIQAKAESLMSAGYQRLLTFEHPGGGFSWFGTQDPAPFLSVTAFGLMEFSDMAKIQTVDEAMIDRTRSWLLAQQKADGSWEGDQSEFFTFHTSNVRNTAFVVWALASSGYSGAETDRGLAFVHANLGAEATDPYTLALAANAALLAAPSDPGTADLVAKLEAAKKTDGDRIYWDSEGTQTNFYGGGNDAAVATTALVAHALLLDGGHAADVAGALAYLTASKDPAGNFGSTQATIWTLRTLLLAATKGTEGAVGTLEVALDGARFSTVTLTEAQADVMTTVDLSTSATTGDHDVTLTFEGTGKVSYNLVASHHLPWAAVPPEPQGPLSIAVQYDKTNLRVDETVLSTVTVGNNTATTQNMVLLTVGIPPGFTVVTDDLDKYQVAGTLSRYELTGKQLILYVSTLPANGTLGISYHLTATLPVTVDDGGAQAMLYYEPEKKAAAAAQKIAVAAN